MKIITHKELNQMYESKITEIGEFFKAGSYNGSIDFNKEFITQECKAIYGVGYYSFKGII